MQISVLSGKGGTGKTTVATNLAATMGWRYVDCDVEEPNGAIFLKPEVSSKEDVTILNPSVDISKCTLCGKCVSVCQYNALAKTKKSIVVFEKMCHGCGACVIICPQNAITEIDRPIGVIETGFNGKIECITGILDLGEPMAGPIISKLKKNIKKNGDSIIDCSPGSSCNVVKSVLDSDYAILVTEPTEFGLHDLDIAVKLLLKLSVPFGIVINRDAEADNIITQYCNKNNIKILGKIPFKREIAFLYSKGDMLINTEEYNRTFNDIALKVREEIKCS